MFDWTNNKDGTGTWVTAADCDIEISIFGKIKLDWGWIRVNSSLGGVFALFGTKQALVVLNTVVFVFVRKGIIHGITIIVAKLKVLIIGSFLARKNITVVLIYHTWDLLSYVKV